MHTLISKFRIVVAEIIKLSVINNQTKCHFTICILKTVLVGRGKWIGLAHSSNTTNFYVVENTQNY